MQPAFFPKHLWKNKAPPNRNEVMMEQWLKWAVELQSMAQAGLAYTDNVYDIERYERLREISAEIIASKADISLDKVKDLFCGETGYQTPKLDTRAAIFQNGKILLVHENNGTWSLPGGWCDVLESVKSNTIKEVREETGLDVETVKIIALQDRNRHNQPVYAYGVCKVFVLCRVLGGAFASNLETTETRYFALEELPDNLAQEKTTKEQIAMCFRAPRRHFYG